MILLLGGTTEAKQVATFLEEAGFVYIYSTRTEVNFSGKGKYRFGGLDKEQMEDFCVEEGVEMIIDACHPFARELHQTVASIELDISLVRYQRHIPQRVDHPLVEYIEDYSDALTMLEQRSLKSLLALSGVQSIPLLRSYWSKHITWFRILERDYSKDFAANYKFPEEYLIYGLPQKKEEEQKLLDRLKPEVVLTKESGVNGKVGEKIAAAIACKIPIMVLKAPLVPPELILVDDLEQLKRVLPHA
ncbi:MAG: precorrin-6A/cobalt-precorrin-6A reductase [Bacteroidota bacterium]